jgi:hypothetical protein
MALQTSGVISMTQIYSEVTDSSRPSPVALSSCENGTYRTLTRVTPRPSGTTPTRMGEFYGYQGGHNINVRMDNNTGMSAPFAIDCYGDEGPGYEYESYDNYSNGTIPSYSSKTIQLIEPLRFYAKLNPYSYSGAIFIYIDNSSFGISNIAFYDSNGVDRSAYITNIYYSSVEQGAYIFYAVPTGTANMSFYTVIIGIGYYGAT